MSYGEKLIKEEVKEDKVIRTYEIKNFDYDFYDLALRLNDYVSDNEETLQENGIYFDFNDDLFNMDSDKVNKWVNELIKEKIDENNEVPKYLLNSIEPLMKAKGYIIYFKLNKANDE